MLRLRSSSVLAACVLAIGCGSDSGGGDVSNDAGDSGDSGAFDGGHADGGADSIVTDAPHPDAVDANDVGPAPIAGLHAFYTDLTSGPSTGGESGKGAYVTIWGNGFGATRASSTVTIGGGDADNYPIWSDTKITFQLGAAAKSGDVVVHVGGKGDSNGLPFVVRGGNVYFVSPAGDDTGDGSFAHPWATIPKAKNTIAVGDVAYIGTKAGDAVSQTAEDASSPYRCALGMSVLDGGNSGTADTPKALVVYPGATALVGVESGLERGILVPAITGRFDFWVISGFTLRGEVEAIDLEGDNDGWRIVGCDVSCPNGTGLSGCVTGGPTNLKFYGNVVHDAAGNVADSAITKYYHGIYFGSDHLELGWNVVRDGKTCRAIQFHDTGGPNEYDLSVHDNVIHGTVCDGLNFATVDPTLGKVEAFNNVIYDVGHGPDPVDGSSDYACIYVAGTTNTGAAGGGVVELFQNTLYDCGSWTSDSSASAVHNGGGNPKLSVRMRNNLIAQKSGERYVAGTADPSLYTGTSNLWFGAGGAPAFDGSAVTGDPMLVDPSTFDLHLKPGSAAIDHGGVTEATFDLDGNARPQGSAFDIGAYEATK